MTAQPTQADPEGAGNPPVPDAPPPIAPCLETPPFEDLLDRIEDLEDLLERVENLEAVVRDRAATPDPVEVEGGPGSYGAMLEEYLESSTWANGLEHMPLVFHLRQIGRNLDAAGSDATAALSSTYLQAFYRLDKRRPGAPTGPDPDPAQTSIFDHLDDE